MATETKPEWVNIKPAEVEKLVVELAQKGESPSKIGLILRDKHGVPKTKLLGKRISKIIKENKLEIQKEKVNVKQKIDTLNSHITKNKHDQSAKRSLSKTLWVMHKLEKKEN